MPTAYGLTRVSHRRQARSGLGLAAQRRAIEGRYRERLKPRGIAWGEIFSDPAVSGRKRLLARKGGAALDAVLVAGDHVIVAKIDRAFRNTLDFITTLAAWHRRGVHLHVIDVDVDTSTPIGKLVATIMAAIAEWESARIGERIREAKVEQRAEGRSTNGRARLGYRLRGQRLVPDQRARRVFREIVRLRRKGLAWHAIAAELNGRGVRTGERRRWTQQACWRGYQAAVGLKLARDRA